MNAKSETKDVVCIENGFVSTSFRSGYHSNKISFQSLIAHYANPRNTGVDSFEVRTHALEFLSLCCQLWDKFHTEATRPDLLQLLRSFSIMLNVDELYAKELDCCLSSSITSLPQCLAMLDLLILSSQTQPRFVEMVLRCDR